MDDETKINLTSKELRTRTRIDILEAENRILKIILEQKLEIKLTEDSGVI